MGWSVQCNNSKCKSQTWATNIVDLIDNHTDENGWFICSKCGASGFIEKTFDLQEPGHTWEPYLRGALHLGDPDDTISHLFSWLVTSQMENLVIYGFHTTKTFVKQEGV